jgi:Superfamily II DNA/RNA helicases, SNF2 family
METKRKWLEICSKINTSEIDNGSRWFQEEIPEEELDKYEERFLVKWADLSFLHCSWEKKEDLMEQVENPKTYLTTFFRKNHHGYFYGADERMDGEYFDPGFIQIERILDVSPPDGWNAKRMNEKRKRGKGGDNDWGIIHDTSHPDYENGTGRVFLVKWMNTAYSDCTYEYERDLILMDVDYESFVEDFHERNKKPAKGAMKKIFSMQEDGKRQLYKVFGDRLKDDMKEKRIEEFKKKLEDTEFQNGGKLRDYQAEGVSWLLANHINKRSAILADEMGLGKTVRKSLGNICSCADFTSSLTSHPC